MPQQSRRSVSTRRPRPRAHPATKDDHVEEIDNKTIHVHSPIQHPEPDEKRQTKQPSDDDEYHQRRQQEDTTETEEE
jgi:hypothetical protein